MSAPNYSRKEPFHALVERVAGDVQQIVAEDCAGVHSARQRFPTSSRLDVTD